MGEGLLPLPLGPTPSGRLPGPLEGRGGGGRSGVRGN